MAHWEGPGLRDHSDGDDLGPILINFVHLTILIVTSLDNCVNDGCMIETLGLTGWHVRSSAGFVDGEGTQEVEPGTPAFARAKVADSKA